MTDVLFEQFLLNDGVSMFLKRKQPIIFCTKLGFKTRPGYSGRVHARARASDAKKSLAAKDVESNWMQSP